VYQFRSGPSQETVGAIVSSVNTFGTRGDDMSDYVAQRTASVRAEEIRRQVAGSRGRGQTHERVTRSLLRALRRFLAAIPRPVPRGDENAVLKLTGSHYRLPDGTWMHANHG
jgi:hypothetical protein